MLAVAARVPDKGLAQALQNAAALSLKMNRLFDIFNSNSLKSTKSDRMQQSQRMPIMCDNRQIDILEREFLPWIKSIKIIRPVKIPENPLVETTLDPKDKEETTPCILGWQQNIICLKMLWNELKDKYGFEYLFTRRLNQDPLENFFSTVRNSGGHNDHPTSAFFQTLMHGLITNQVMQVTVAGSNCEADLTPLLEGMEDESEVKKKMPAATNSQLNVVEEDIDEPLESNREDDMDDIEMETDAPLVDSEEPIVVDHVHGVALMAAPLAGSNEISKISITISEDDEGVINPEVPDTVTIILTENKAESPNLKDISDAETLTYISGYLVKAIKDHKCGVCVTALTENPLIASTRQYRTFLCEKDWDNQQKLKYASPLLVRITKKMENTFKSNIDSLIHQENICQKLTALCQRDCVASQICQDGQKLIVRKFVHMRVYYYCKFYNKNLKKKRCHQSNDEGDDRSKRRKTKKFVQ